MDKAEKGLGLVEKLIGIVGIGIVLPLFLVAVIFLIIKYNSMKLQAITENNLKAATVQETTAKNIEKTNEKLEKGFQEMREMWGRAVDALARRKGG